jgi:hypothetical protein
MESEQLKIFGLIKQFISTINDCYGNDFINVQLYNRLLEKTTEEHTESITKHISLFTEFATVNETMIKERSVEFVNGEIRYSEKVYLNMKEILDKCSKKEKNTVWKYIILISSKVNENIDAKELLKEEKKESTNFLQDIMETVDEHIDKDATNPLEAMGGLISSGVFTNIVEKMTSGLQNGELNIGNLLGSVNEMMGEMGDNTEMSNLLGNMGNMIDKEEINKEVVVSNQQPVNKKKKRKGKKKK